MTRRNFTKAVAVGLAAQLPRLLRGQRPKQLKIGMSTLAWSVSRNSIDNFEKRSRTPPSWATGIRDGHSDHRGVGRGRLAGLIEKYGSPLKAGYIDVNVTDPSVRKDHVARVIRVAKLVKKHGGNYVVYLDQRQAEAAGPDTFNFLEHKANMAVALNDYGMAAVDLGLGAGLHPHTGTAVEKRDEVYGIMDAVDTRSWRLRPMSASFRRPAPMPLRW